MEYILRNVMLSVLQYPNATLMHVARMLTDKNFKDEVLESVTDPIVLKFRRDEFDKRSDNQRNEAISPITNKIGQFLSSSIVRNIFAQPKSKINIRKIMDEGKILLINLSKGKIGEDNAAMIGSFLVTKLQIDAMSRADTPQHLRKDFFCYIDEFQNFATESFSNILSEARKYRLSLIVANQFTAQIEENVRNAIFGNVGTIVSFGL
ncbi:TraM recognition domain-containing protein [Patescibacteria group bacterium]|nr:TraM recognition domain-containing protein [Patescibacteria group bacterium]